MEAGEDGVVAIEGEEGLHVYQLAVYALGGEVGVDGVFDDAQGAAVADDGDVLALAQHLGDAERDGEGAEVGGGGFLEAVAVEALYYEAGFVALQQGVVHAGGLRHVARHAEVDAADGVEDHAHGAAAVPDALQAMAARADDERAFLAAVGAVLQRGDVVGEGLQAVEEVVEILDFGDGAQAAHGHAKALTNDGCLADAGVENAAFAIFILQAGEALVYVANLAEIFAEGKDGIVSGEELIEVLVEHFVAVALLRVVGIFGRYYRHFQRILRALAVEMAVEFFGRFRL